jgi:hypothetical protein
MGDVKMRKIFPRSRRSRTSTKAVLTGRRLVGTLKGRRAVTEERELTGLARGSAGIVKVTNGSTGYGSLDASGYSLSGVGWAPKPVPPPSTVSGRPYI